MALDSLTSNELLNFIILETLSATQFISNEFSSENKILLDNDIVPKQQSLQVTHEALINPFEVPILDNKIGTEICKNEKNLGVQGGRKKRRRRQKVSKNKEQAENQRMTHIAVERNRRKQMNEHLAVLRSLMPESYVQRGDQASIVGGALEFVKRLEHTLQSLESQKYQLLQQGIITTTVAGAGEMSNDAADITGATPNLTTTMSNIIPFAQFFSYPQYTCSQSPIKIFTSKRKCDSADIEVTLIETHANVRILSQRRFRQLSKLVASFQALYLTILHLNVTTLDPLVLYSISAKVEEGCQFSSVDDIASVINHILRIIDEESTLCS